MLNNRYTREEPRTESTNHKHHHYIAFIIIITLALLGVAEYHDWN